MHQETFPSFRKTPSKKPQKYFFTFIIILLFSGFIYYSASKIMGVKEEKPQKEEITPSPTEFIFPTDPPVSIVESPTPEVTTTLDITPTVNPIDKTTGFNRSKLSIAIQNGSGEVGAASKASEILKSFGYNVVSSANADSFTYENVSINVKKDKSGYLSLLKKDLGITYTIGSTSATLPLDYSSDVIVIIGKQ